METNKKVDITKKCPGLQAVVPKMYVRRYVHSLHWVGVPFVPIYELLSQKSLHGNMRTYRVVWKSRAKTLHAASHQLLV